MPTLDDYRWLVGPTGAHWLDRLSGESDPAVSDIKRVRKTLSPARTHLLFEQLELRRRAEEKFDAAARMFFARRSLEQATDQGIAELKSERYPPGQLVVDGCCGIGGDLLALAGRGCVVGIERDPIVARLAAANVKALDRHHAAIVRAEVERSCWAEAGAWHLDPDRRAGSRKRSQLAGYQPSVAAIDRMLDECPHGGVKMAPAATIPDRWAHRAERQWLGSRGQCRQQMVWFGQLAHRPGYHTVSLVSADGQRARTVAGRPAESGPVPIAPRIGRFVHEPHPALAAARLVATVAAEHQLQFIGGSNGYLTSDDPVVDAWTESFEVLEVLPLDVKRLNALLKERGVGRLEIKKRGVAANVDELRRQLSAHGKRAAVLMVATHHSATTAIIAQRCGTLAQTGPGIRGAAC